jgi:hypothetical protein
MLDTGCWILDAGYWMLDTGCWILDAGWWMLDAGCWMVDGGYPTSRNINSVYSINFDALSIIGT